MREAATADHTSREAAIGSRLRPRSSGLMPPCIVRSTAAVMRACVRIGGSIAEQRSRVCLHASIASSPSRRGNALVLYLSRTPSLLVPQHSRSLLKNRVCCRITPFSKRTEVHWSVCCRSSWYSSRRCPTSGHPWPRRTWRSGTSQPSCNGRSSVPSFADGTESSVSGYHGSGHAGDPLCSSCNLRGL